MTIEPAAMAADIRRPQQLARWGQLAAGILCMVMIANLQYGWTLFVDPMNAANHWGRRHPDRVHDLHRHRDLARAGRRLVRRPAVRVAARIVVVLSAASWSRSPGRSIRSSTLCRCSTCGAGAVRRGAGARLRHLRRQRAEMVRPIAGASRPGSPPPGSAPARRATVIPITHDDRRLTATSRVPLVRHRSGGGRLVLALSCSARPKPGETPTAARLTQAARHDRRCEMWRAPVSGSSMSCSSWSGERPDGDRAGGADRQGLQHRRHAVTSCSSPRRSRWRWWSTTS